MLTLLLIPDAIRRQRLLAACARAGLEVQAADPSDAGAAVFSMALDRVDVLVFDPEGLRRQGLAMLANWRRMAPRSRLLLLSDNTDEDLQRVQGALA